MKKGIIFVSLVIILLANANAASAEQGSEFPSCIAPQGKLIANYDNGTHGIIGQGSRIGKDSVYLLDNGNTAQCFCSVNGHGIQTNWQKTSSLTQDEIKILENEGWIFVPDGTAWGLPEGSYLAKNSDYACYSSSTTNSSSGTSIVQSASGNLASTGNILFIAQILGLGVLFSLIGIALRLRQK